MDSVVQQGDVTEMKVATRLLELGYGVMTPLTDNERYDLLIDTKEERGYFTRAQVRTGQDKDGVISFRCYTNTKTSDGYTSRSFTSDEIDAYVVYSPELDTCYFVPIDEAPEKEMYLRYEDTNQEKRVNWADNYTLMERLGQTEY
jgi:hypothetical protein